MDQRLLDVMLGSAHPKAAPQTAGKASNHWPFLDFLRAISALLVMFAHSRPLYFVYINFFDEPNVFLKLFYFVTGVGHEAVVIFFVLSGFLIGGSLADSMLRGDFKLSYYLIARFTRLYTVYLPALLITQGVFFFGGLLLSEARIPSDWFAPLFSHAPKEADGASQAICFLAGLQGFACPAWVRNPVLWSLGFEWALYLFAPAIIQLIVWKAARALRLMAIALVCAIAATVCSYHNPVEAVFWFAAWFLGVGANRVMRSWPAPLPLGLTGVGLIIAGMLLAHLYPDFPNRQPMTDSLIALGAAIAIACPRLAAYPLAPRFFAWAAGFSYTLYAVHLPFVFLAATMFRQLGIPADIEPSLTPFGEFGFTVALCLSAAYLVSLFTEAKTGQIRAAFLRMCPSRAYQPGNDKSLA